ncbi:membrane protein [Microbacterium phage Luna18]|nr:hypothetical protein SEA_CHEPLI_31 [Microbacterium phage Chepli]QZE10319.1 hypothetical protein SEA_KATCHAN_31 [Microbacterium phage KatChan]URQ04882.1 membrane protein [Microbacterium phage Luna18]
MIDELLAILALGAMALVGGVAGVLIVVGVQAIGSLIALWLGK